MDNCEHREDRKIYRSCLYCLFDGTVEEYESSFPQEWECEVLPDMCKHAYKIGWLDGLQSFQKATFCKSFMFKAMKKLYQRGYKNGKQRAMTIKVLKDQIQLHDNGKFFKNGKLITIYRKNVIWHTINEDGAKVRSSKNLIKSIKITLNEGYVYIGINDNL